MEDEELEDGAPKPEVKEVDPEAEGRGSDTEDEGE